MKLCAIAAACAAVLFSTGAEAVQVAALVGDNTIAIVDTAARKVTRSWPIAGVSARVTGIDVRPADGMLYALTADGNLYTVDMTTGKATLKSQLAVMTPPGVAAAVDFNPVADRLRVIGADGTSLRVNPDDGKVVEDGRLRFADADRHKGRTPKVSAAAYTNSVKGAKQTTLYDIDGASGALLRQDPPNDGVLNTIGMTGIKGGVVAFDIWSDGNGMNEAWAMSPAGLHSIDLTTGKAGPAIAIGGRKGAVRDIAILPAM